MSDDLNHSYESLGLTPGATQEDVRETFRDLAKIWRPDRFAHDPLWLWEWLWVFSSFLATWAIVLLHSLIKKSQKTPPVELKTARQRLVDLSHE